MNLRKAIRQYWPLLIFLTITCSSLLSMLLSRGALVLTYFHPDPVDSGMDFFNCLASASSDSPYKYGSNYPPMCHLILKALHLIVPVGEPTDAQLAASQLTSAGFYLRLYQNAYLVFIVSVIGCTLTIAGCVLHMAAGCRERDRYLLAGATCISGPFLFLLERGNILIFALAGVFVFLALSNSKSSICRLAAYVALAFSASIKIYPFIFSLLLLRERKVRAFLFVLIVTICMFVFPFLYFGGLEAARSFFDSLTRFVSGHSALGLGLKYSIDNALGILETIFGFACPPLLSSGLTLIVFTVGSCLILFSPSRARAIACAGFLCAAIPSTSYTYSLTFLLPAFIYANIDCINLRSSLSSRLINFCLGLSLAAYSLPLVPINGNTFTDAKYPLFWGCLIGNVALAVMFFSMSIQLLPYVKERMVAVHHLRQTPRDVGTNALRTRNKG